MDGVDGRACRVSAVRGGGVGSLARTASTVLRAREATRPGAEHAHARTHAETATPRANATRNPKAPSPPTPRPRARARQEQGTLTPKASATRNPKAPSPPALRRRARARQRDRARPRRERRARVRRGPVPGSRTPTHTEPRPRRALSRVAAAPDRPGVRPRARRPGPVPWRARAWSGRSAGGFPWRRSSPGRGRPPTPPCPAAPPGRPR